MQERMSGTSLENGVKRQPVCEGPFSKEKIGHSSADGFTLVTRRGGHRTWAIGAQLGRRQMLEQRP